MTKGNHRGMIMRIISPVLAGAGMAVVMVTSAWADDISRAEGWFNKLTTYQAQFTQVASDGSNATGMFSLKRPYRSRFDYDDPLALVLITSKTWLHVDEADRREVTSYPLSETPLSLMLADPVRLRSPDVITTSASQDGVIYITIEQEDGEAAGKLVMEFTDQPFELRRWVVTDANGITTSVLLSNPVKGLDLANKLFVPTDYPNASPGN
ncbi:MAG: outer membrane lipoprotein carrier protein LolA [Alphaproteobacteria bacterium]|nr:outer membrane lipoprotein carrier protein LolA [Alphaproteobacteria bacterium]